MIKTRLPLLALLLLGALVVPASNLHAQPWVTGNYSAWNTTMPVSAIPWDRYTHVLHFAATTNGTGDLNPYYLVRRSANDYTEIAAFVQAGHDHGKYVLMTIKDNDNDLNAFGNSTAPATVGAFVTNIAGFVNDHLYDGVSIDWEKNVNVTQFADLMDRLRKAMPGKILAIDGNPRNSQAAGLAAKAGDVDQVNVMCFDMDWGSSVTWYVSPLQQAGNENVNTCDWDVAYFTSAGVRPDQLGIGIPFYARQWKGATQPLQRSSWNRTNTLFYRDLASDPTRWQPSYRKYDPVYRANYLSIPSLNEFDSYTDAQYINDTVSWGTSKGFGGYLTFAMEYEYMPADAEPHPLSKALYDAVQAGTVTVPKNDTPPSISGTVRAGQTLTASVGAWSGTPPDYSWQWYRGSSPIAGATSSTYVLGTADVGSTIKVMVTATTAAGASSAYSAPTTTVGAARGKH